MANDMVINATNSVKDRNSLQMPTMDETPSIYRGDVFMRVHGHKLVYVFKHNSKLGVLL
jgi:hypothetical protein